MPAPESFDVIIIGTGFGANVVVTELLQNPGFVNKKILLLERGAWWVTPERPLPGYLQGKDEPIQYWPRPNNQRGLTEMLSVVKTPTIDMRNRPGGAPQPLYYYNSFDDVDILTSSGVGGGSLIYSNVSVRPFDEGGNHPVMDDWPAKLTPADYDGAAHWMEDFRGTTAKGATPARKGEAIPVVTRFPVSKSTRDDVIASAPGSDQNLLLGRTRWLKEASAKNVGADFEQVKKWAPLDLQIFEYDGKPDTSSSPPCERQGRCFLGCLPGARHTLNKTLMNYVLTDPRVQLCALAEVDTMEPAPGGGYLIHYENHRVGDHDPDRKKQVKAPVVVLAAGVLGTTKLLLRSRDTMTFSDELGRHFSTNGDAAGFIRYSAPYTYPLWATRGPINTSHVMYRVKNTGTFINVEDAGVPSMFAETVKRALEAFGNGVSHNPLLSALDLAWNVVKDGNPLRDLFHAPDARKAGDAQTEDEMLQHVFFFNLMGRDRSRGRFELNDKRELKLGFEGGPLSDDPVYRKMDELMKAMADAMNTGQSTGKYVRFPFWGRGAKLLDNEFHAERRAITVHPLGGCRMGNTSSEGVVDVKGRVFNTAAGGDSVHGGLYIADGSVMPGPLAVNPTLTIVAMAQKIAVNIQQAAAAGG